MSLQKRLLITLIGAVFLFSGWAFAQTEADAANGVWLNQTKEGYVQVYAENGKYHGHIVGAPEDSPRRDESGESLLGTLILEDFTYAGDGHWEDGTVFDPDNDKTYSSNMRLEDPDTLKIRGYLGFSLLGRTVVWTRVPDDAPGVEQGQLK